MSATPALCALLMNSYTPREEAGWLRRCKRLQQWAILRLQARPGLVLAAVLLFGAAGVVLLPLLGAAIDSPTGAESAELTINFFEMLGSRLIRATR